MQVQVQVQAQQVQSGPSENGIKRLTREMKMIEKEKANLAARGIYFSFNDSDIDDVCILISPIKKDEGGSQDLFNPYVGGFFAFQVQFDSGYPFTPPKVEFHPKQSQCRLHPNYYENGKVCLSLINTWGNNDWSPAVSLMSLANMLEERFTETALLCEPGTPYDIGKFKKYNSFVLFWKLKYAIDTFVNSETKRKTTVFLRFNDVIQELFKKNKTVYADELKRLDEIWADKEAMNQERYSGYSMTKDDYLGIKAELTKDL